MLEQGRHAAYSSRVVCPANDFACNICCCCCLSSRTLTGDGDPRILVREAGEGRLARFGWSPREAAYR